MNDHMKYLLHIWFVKNLKTLENLTKAKQNGTDLQQVGKLQNSTGNQTCLKLQEMPTTEIRSKDSDWRVRFDCYRNTQKGHHGNSGEQQLASYDLQKAIDLFSQKSKSVGKKVKKQCSKSECDQVDDDHFAGDILTSKRPTPPRPKDVQHIRKSSEWTESKTEPHSLRPHLVR